MYNYIENGVRFMKKTLSTIGSNVLKFLILVKNLIIKLFSNKRNVIILAVLIVAIVFICVIFNKNSNSSSNVIKKQKEELSGYLEQMGKDFYENFYYDQIGDDSTRATFLSKFTTIGIKVNLDNLSRISDDNASLAEKFVNSSTGEACDKDDTKVYIYPTEPYGKTNYTITVEL